ncbi:cytochrome c3 family protein [Thermincola ferriacetica]
MSTRRNKLIGANNGNGRRRKKFFAVLLVFLLGVLLIAALNIAMAETADVLGGDGDFEGTQYSRWRTFSEGGGTVFSQTNATAYTNVYSAQQYISLTATNLNSDTAGYEHVFALPSEGVNSVTVSFNYRIYRSTNNYGTWEVGWEICDWNGVQKAAGLLTDVSNTWKSFSAPVNGLTAGNRYLFRLYWKVGNQAGKSLTAYVYWDNVKVNIDYTHSAGPLIFDLKPPDGTLIHGTAGLSLWAWDPKGIKQAPGDGIKWEYSSDSGSTWHVIGATYNSTVDSYTYGIDWDTGALPDGLYQVRAVAKDSLDEFTVSDPKYYTLENQGPVLSNFTPVDGDRLKGDQKLSVSAQDPAGIGRVTWEYSPDNGTSWIPIGSSKKPESVAGDVYTFSYIFPTEDLPDMNNYLIRVTAVDSSPWGHKTVSPGVTYHIDNNPPEISQINPQMWSYLRGHVQTLSANVTDANGIAGVEWQYSTDGGATWTFIGSDHTPDGTTYSVNWDTAAAGGDGAYLIKIVATNRDGDTSIKTFTYYVDNTRPVLSQVIVRTKNMVDIEFIDSCMDSGTAKNPAVYQIYESGNPVNVLEISAVQLKGDQRTIRLITADQTVGTRYTVEVDPSVTDAAGNILNTDPPNVNKLEFVGMGSTTFYPHGNFDLASELCATCHVTHAAAGPVLLQRENEKLLCYMCHDASGISTKNILAEFGSIDAVGANTSHHGVPNDQQSCIDCHNPHDGAGVHYPKLLDTRDANGHEYNSGNDVCFACHGSPALHGGSVRRLTGIPGVDDHETYYAAATVYDGDMVGAHVYKNNGTDAPLAPPDPQTQINCSACHEKHGSRLPKLLRESVNGGKYNVEGNNNTLCYACHEGPMGTGDAPYLGRTVYEATYLNAHGRKSTGVLYPGGPYSVSRTLDSIPDEEQRGQCLNCHNPHGTPYGKMLVDLYQVTPPDDPDAGSTAGILKYNALCFKCHDSDGPAQDIARYYSGSYRKDDGTSVTASGHYVHEKGFYIDGKPVPLGYCIPCNDCHNPHGSANNNNKLLNDRLGSNLYDGTVANQRAMCLKCHTATDDSVLNQWRGNNMPRLPDLAATWPQVTTINQHARNVDPAKAKPCSDCHGYGDPMQAAHAPEPYGRSPGGKDCDLCHELTDWMGMNSVNYRHQITSFAADYNPPEGYTCLSMCHTDHNVFNEENPPTFAGTDPGKHLRVTGGNTAVAPVTGILPTDKRGVNELCMSCHRVEQNNHTYLSPGGTESAAGIYDFVYGTDSWHPIMQAPKPNLYVNSTTAYPPWDNFDQDPNNRMVCLDCHNTDGTRPAGPHSSTNKYMLKRVGTNTALHPDADNRTNQGVLAYDALCVMCHKETTYGVGNTAGSGTGSIAPATHSKQYAHYTVNAYGCYGCHSGNPDMLKEVTSGKEQGIGGGALRGSIHGRTYKFDTAIGRTEALIHGNLISKFDSANGGSCTAKVGISECQMNTQPVQ